jgi:hypothetical protein
VFWVFAFVACVCTCIILLAVPELLASALVAAAILTPQYLTRERHTMTDHQALEIEQRDGKPYLVTAPPLPEHITLSRGLWDSVAVYDPEVDGDTGLEPPQGLWREAIPHADEDRENDGWVITFDATNSVARYRVTHVPESGDIQAVLGGYGEK